MLRGRERRSPAGPLTWSTSVHRLDNAPGDLGVALWAADWHVTATTAVVAYWPTGLRALVCVPSCRARWRLRSVGQVEQDMASAIEEQELGSYAVVTVTLRQHPGGSANFLVAKKRGRGACSSSPRGTSRLVGRPPSLPQGDLAHLRPLALEVPDGH